MANVAERDFDSEHQGATFIGQEDVAAGMASFGLVAPAAIAVQAVELLA